MSLKYDAVLYDLDGTLIDSIPVIIKCFRLAYLELYGECSRSDEDFLNYIGLPLGETFSMHDPETAKKLVDKYLEINEQMLKDGEVVFFEGVRDMLMSVKTLGVKQGIVTSKRKVSAAYTLDLMDAWKLFDKNVFREDTEEHKPLAGPIIKAAEYLGITDMSRILYVGDAWPDAECAHNAGCDFALVDWTYMDRSNPLMANPTYIIKSPCDLSCIIKNPEL